MSDAVGHLRVTIPSSEWDVSNVTTMSGGMSRDHYSFDKHIQCVEMGRYTIPAWYYSPYPDDVCGGAEEDKLYLCEYCLCYMRSASMLRRHCSKCSVRTPPGKEIYREKGLSMFEVDGEQNKIYCQNLCLLSKLFLDHKTLYYDVDLFIFYILCEVDEEGCHMVGYFSKEKISQENYNLSCILTFPPYQRKGYGKFLISISYELTIVEKKVGSPEKPISDLGRISYESYWSYVILQHLCYCGAPQITIKDLSQSTGICIEDVVSTLHDLNIVKDWKGQAIIALHTRMMEQHLARRSRIRLANPEYLHWTPPVIDINYKIN